MSRSISIDILLFPVFANFCSFFLMERKVLKLIGSVRCGLFIDQALEGLLFFNKNS